jgi:hypothetical protein
LCWLAVLRVRGDTGCLAGASPGSPASRSGHAAVGSFSKSLVRTYRRTAGSWRLSPSLAGSWLKILVTCFPTAPGVTCRSVRCSARPAPPRRHLGTAKQHKETVTYGYPTNSGWPGSSPLVTAIGGTQLQYGWTWDPKSDVPFHADGSENPGYWNSTAGGNRQVVWNETWLPAATSGGPSVICSLPPGSRASRL